MVSGDFTKRVIGFFPWGPGDGLPEMRVAGVMYGNEWWIPARVRPVTKLRVLADGRIQLLVPARGGARLVGLGEPAVHVDVQFGSWVLDAVLGADGSVVTFERLESAEEGGESAEFVIRQIRPDATPGWRLTSAEPENLLGEVTVRSRLLSAPGGRIYLANRGSLLRVDDGSGDCLLRWRGMDAITLPDGGIGFGRYDESGRRADWVTVDLSTGSETVVAGGRDHDQHLSHAIGVDDTGNVFRSFGGELARVPKATVADWSLRLEGIVVAAPYGITTMSVSADRRTALLEDDRGVEIDLSDDVRRGSLVNRTDTGGYVLYQRTRGNYGTLVYLDETGEFVRSEDAAEDVWFTNSQTQSPSVGSVTRDGEVLIAVHGSDGLHVVGIKPELSTTGAS
jgi:hypothetical protein